MRYGLLADIHEEVEFLGPALDRFARDGVDRVIVLGDLFETGPRLEETTALLRRAGAVGVWGNHDYGLCVDPSEFVRCRFSPACLEYMGSLRPKLEFEDCLVTHVAPWRDAEDILELWTSFEPDDPARSFAAHRHRLLFQGHHHRWKVTTPDGPVAWNWLDPLALRPGGRYLIEVGAVMDGRCGILDTGADLLFPIDLRDGD